MRYDQPRFKIVLLCRDPTLTTNHNWLQSSSTHAYVTSGTIENLSLSCQSADSVTIRRLHLTSSAYRTNGTFIFKLAIQTSSPPLSHQCFHLFRQVLAAISRVRPFRKTKKLSVYTGSETNCRTISRALYCAKYYLTKYGHGKWTSKPGRPVTRKKEASTEKQAATEDSDVQ